MSPVQQVDLRYSVFDLTRCGYFEWRGQDPVVDMSQEGMRQLAEWVHQQRSLSATGIEAYGEDADEVHDGPVSQMFCRGIQEDSHSLLFAMFQQLDESQKGLTTIALDDKVNDALAKPVQLSNGRVAGSSRYFFLLPKERVLCAVMLNTRTHALSSFRSWVLSYLRFHATAVARLHTDDKGMFLKEKLRADDPTAPRLWARVNASPVESLAEMQRVRSLAKEIVAVRMRGRFEPRYVRKKGLFVGLLDLLPTSLSDDRKTKARVELREPTPNGLSSTVVDQMIRWERDSGGNMDVGFEFRGGVVSWVGKVHSAKRKVDLKCKDEGVESVDLRVLHEYLSGVVAKDAIRTVRDAREAAAEQRAEEADDAEA